MNETLYTCFYEEDGDEEEMTDTDLRKLLGLPPKALKTAPTPAPAPEPAPAPAPLAPEPAPLAPEPAPEQSPSLAHGQPQILLSASLPAGVHHGVGEPKGKAKDAGKLAMIRSYQMPVAGKKHKHPQKKILFLN